jgi:hypothetical protein
MVGSSGADPEGARRDHVYEQLEYKKLFSLDREDNNRIASEAFPLSAAAGTTNKSVGGKGCTCYIISFPIVFWCFDYRTVTALTIRSLVSALTFTVAKPRN